MGEAVCLGKTAIRQRCIVWQNGIIAIVGIVKKPAVGDGWVFGLTSQLGGLVLKVRAILGLGSRYSYLASTQLDRIADEIGADIEWCPVNSIELIRRARPDGSPFDQPVLSGQYAPEFRYRDACRWAAHYGIKFNEPCLSSIPPNAMALACWSQSDRNKRQSLMKAIYAAVFVDGVEMTLDILEAIAADFDVTREQISDALDGGTVSRLHDKAISMAVDLGVFGVPSFVCGEEVFWGNDRLALLIEHVVSNQTTG